MTELSANQIFDTYTGVYITQEIDVAHIKHSNCYRKPVLDFQPNTVFLEETVGFGYC